MSVAALELADPPAVHQGVHAHEPVVGVEGETLHAGAAQHRLAGLPDQVLGSPSRVATVGDTGEAPHRERDAMPHDGAAAAHPRKPHTIGQRSVGVVEGGSFDVADAGRRVLAEVRRCARVVDPHLHPTPAALQFLQPAQHLLATRPRTVTPGVHAVYVPGVDHRFDDFPIPPTAAEEAELVVLRIGKETVADLQPQTRPHRSLLRRVEELLDGKEALDRPGRVDVAAYGGGRTVGIRKAPQSDPVV